MKQLWYGGNIYTMESEGQKVEAVLVDQGKIIATGSVAQLLDQAEEKIDLQGATMYPGFVDSHLHMLYQGEKLIRLDLSGATSAEHMLQIVRDAARDLTENQWLFGEGWNENNFAIPRIPTIAELDEISDAPIILTRICHHVLLANTSAFKAGGINEAKQNPAGGIIGRDDSGEMNGLLYDQAMNLILDAVSKEGEAYKQQLVNLLELTVQDMLSKGLTGGHTEDMHYFGSFYNPYEAFMETVGKKQNFRVNLLRHHVVFKEMMDADLSYAEPFVEPGAMKIFADGALGGATAALSLPYLDHSNTNGMLIHTDEELVEIVKLARSYHQPVAIHMIGDAAADQILNIIEKYPPPQGTRDRLIHGCVLREDLIERMKGLPIVIDIQPLFVPSDFPWVIERLGVERLSYAYAWKTLLDQDIPCAIGTDAPIEELDPLLTIYAAVERKKVGESGQGNLPEQKLSRFEAIRLYTYGSAMAINKEHERGLIKEGYDADFTIFDRDLYEGTSEEMLQAKVVKTVVAGKVVYEG